MDDVTYGALMDRANEQLTVAWRQLRYAPPADVEAIRAAVLTFNELGHALTQLAIDLTGEGPALYRTHRPTDPRFRAATRFVDALATAFPDKPEPVDHPAQYSLAARLKGASVAIRAATELLRTHKSADGHWQTPQSPAYEDPSARLVALDRVADLSVAMTYACTALSSAARLEGTMKPWMRKNWPSRVTHVRGFARELRSLIPGHAGPGVIDNATVANPRIRRSDPAIELTDRLERMRITAWRAAVYPSVETGVPTLIDFATAAVLVHGRAAIVTARAAGVSVRDPRLPTDVRALATQADRWRGIRKRLMILLSPSVSDPALTEDLRAVRDLLGRLTSRRSLYTGLRAARLRAEGAVDPSELTSLMSHASDVFESIAASNAVTIRVLHSAGLLYTPGQLLANEKTQAHPGHLTSSFTRTEIRVEKEQVNRLLIAYGTVHARYSLEIPDVFQSPDGPIVGPLAPGL